MHTHAGPRPTRPPERRGGDRSPPVSPAPKGGVPREAGLHIATIRFRRTTLEAAATATTTAPTLPGPRGRRDGGSRSLSPTARGQAGPRASRRPPGEDAAAGAAGGPGPT